MAIMNSSVTTTSGEREKADVFEILFRLNNIQGKAKMALKKLNEADTALLKVLNLFRLNYIQGKAKMALKKLNEADTALLKVPGFALA